MKIAEIVGGVFLIVSSTTGALVWTDARYASRIATEEAIAGLAVQYQQQREDATDRMIYELEKEKAKKGRLSEFEDREYKRLLRDRQRIKEEIKRLLKENK